MTDELPITRVPRDEIFLTFAAHEIAGALKALDDVERLAGVREVRVPGVEVREFVSVIAAIRFALHLSGSASRIFWPPRTKERGERLRALVRLPDSHGLGSRRLRDHIEHLDERLDNWTEESPRPFTWVYSVLHDDLPPQTRTAVFASTLMQYDAGSNAFTVLGDAFKLDELRRNLEEVRDLISAAFGRMYSG